MRHYNPEPGKLQQSLPFLWRSHEVHNAQEQFVMFVSAGAEFGQRLRSNSRYNAGVINRFTIADSLALLHRLVQTLEQFRLDRGLDWFLRFEAEATCQDREEQGNR